MFRRLDGGDEGKVQVGLFPRPLVGLVEARDERRGGDQVDVVELRPLDERQTVRILGRIEETFHAGDALAFAEERVAQVALGIGIDQQAAEAPLFAYGRQQPGRVRFADPALQVEHGDHRCRLRILLHGGIVAWPFFQAPPRNNNRCWAVSLNEHRAESAFLVLY